MDYAALQAEILANPACAAHVVTFDMPKEARAYVKDSAIAKTISASRVRIESREVGDGSISLALGIPAGPIFLYKLKKLAATPIADDATDDVIAPIAVAQQAVESLSKGSFDVGNEQVRAGLEMFAGTLLSAEQITAIKALAEVPDNITAADVSRALRGPWKD